MRTAVMIDVCWINLLLSFSLFLHKPARRISRVSLWKRRWFQRRSVGCVCRIPNCRRWETRVSVWACTNPGPRYSSQASRSELALWPLHDAAVILKLIIFKHISRIDILSISYTLGNATRPHWWLVNTGSGNGLELSGTKPLPEALLTEISVTIWCHKTTMS